MIFEDDLLKRGEAGGKEAAHQLWNNIREDCENRGIAVSPRIMAKLYVNIRGLASTCYRAGIVETPKVVEDFFRGFTSGRLLFDTVDAGAGKEKSDSKVSGKSNLHVGKLFVAELSCNLEQTLTNKQSSSK